MGIRFHCNHCEKRLNVKVAQAGEFCICPDCESEIQIPLESTIEPKKKRKKKKRHKRPVEVDVSPVVNQSVAQEVEREVTPFEPISQASLPLSDLVSSSVVAPAEEAPDELVVEEVSVANSDPAPVPVPDAEPTSKVELVDEAVESADAVEEVSAGSNVAVSELVAEPDAESESEIVLAALPEPYSPPLDSSQSPPQVEAKLEPELDESAPDSANFGDNDDIDSAAALDQLMDSGDELETETPSEETESFLLAKPVAKIGEDPLKGNPDLVWYLRHKRLGEKGPLKAREIEAMLEAGQIRRGFIVWREDWNDWLPAEKIFPELAEKKTAESTYEIPEDLNPHSEVNRKRRAKKRFWLCFNAAAFLLLLVLVYWVTQFGS